MKKRRIEPRDLLNFILPAGPQISPNGRLVAFSRKHFEEKFKAVTNIWLVDTRTKESRPFSNGGSDTRPRWSPDGANLAFVRRREKAPPQLFLIPLEGGEARAVSDLPEGDIGDFKWAPDGKTIAFTFRKADPDFTAEAKTTREKEGRATPPRVIDSIFYRLDGDEYFNGRAFDLFLLDLDTKKHRKLFDKAKLGISLFDWSPDSREIAFIADLGKHPDTKPWTSRLYRLDVKTGKAAPLPGQKDGMRSGLAWSPNGKAIAFTALMGTEETFRPKNHHLFLTDLKTGKTRGLTETEDYCLDATGVNDIAEISFNPVFRWLPDNSGLIAEIGWHGNRQAAFISAESGKIRFCTHVQGMLYLGNVSNRTPTLALSINNGTALPEIAVGTFRQGKLNFTVLTECNAPLLTSLELSPPEMTWITGSEGTKLQVWAIKPHGFKKGRKYPAILEVHGGPHCYYGDSFFLEFQLLAAQGFAVFYSNPRGSKSYGEQFCDCITGDWGNRDWDDIRSVIRFMCHQTFVDPAHLGIIGGSYGGFMTNWAISHTNAFAAAVTDRSCSNLVSLVGTSDMPNPTDSYFPGNPWDRSEALWNQSPIKYFAKVKTPTLVIHSEGDLRCNVEQGDQVFHALQLLGVPTRFVRYPAETSHGMSRNGPPDLRIHRLEQIISWFRKYLKPD